MRLEDSDVLKHVPLEKPSRPSSCTTKNLDEVDQDFELWRKKYVRWELNPIKILGTCSFFGGIWNWFNRFQSGFEDALWMYPFFRSDEAWLGRTFWVRHSQREPMKCEALGRFNNEKPMVGKGFWAYHHDLFFQGTVEQNSFFSCFNVVLQLMDSPICGSHGGWRMPKQASQKTSSGWSEERGWRPMSRNQSFCRKRVAAFILCDRVDQLPWHFHRVWETQPKSVGVYIPIIRIPY